MKSTSSGTRRALGAAFAACAVGGVVAAVTIPTAPSATAAPDPCAASTVAKTVGSVATSMGSYLDTHPETNQALTTISQQEAGPQSLAALKTYFDANPQAGKDLQALQTPLVSLSSRCQLPLTLPQLLGVMQGAQSQAGSLPAGLPAVSPAAQTVGVPRTAAPALAVPATAATQGVGTLPGPATTPGR